MAYAKITGSDNNIKAGYYEFGVKDGMFKIVRELKAGSKKLMKFTVPEGSTVKQTAGIFASKAAIDKDRFEKNLKKDMKLKEAGLFNKGAFQEASLELDKQSVLLYYQTHGYMDAAVLDVVREVSYNEEKKRDELTLTYIVKEGAQY